MSLKTMIYQLVLVLFSVVLFSGNGVAADNFKIVEGDWQRADGNYLIRVSDVRPDGQVTVKYFNPRSIRVAEADISNQKGFIKLFVRFQDKGYEGSTYTLYYYAEKDSLVGLYYQAAMDRKFKVLFIRRTR